MRTILAIFALIACGVAHAQVAGAPTYRCRDDAGRSIFTNVKEDMAGRTCVVVVRDGSPNPAGQTEQRWSKPRAADGDFVREKNQCMSQGFGAANQDNLLVVFATCMRGKGWELVDVPVK